MGVYHRGERSVQERAGLRDQADVSAAAIKTEIPGIARDFLAAQPLLVIGAADVRGDIWASLLTGEAGFLTVTGPACLLVRATPVPGDPLREALAGPTHLGTIAIEPATRRRMRMNGTSRPTPGGLHVDLDQVYSNCPKYIQKRRPTSLPDAPAAPRHSHRLSAEQAAFVSETDTFFVATTDRHGNADASHRGGNPGFLQALTPTRLRWPDYRGNAMFGTLGNIEVNSRAGLLLPDWSTGNLLQLTGTARVDWQPDRAAGLPPGAQRMVEFTIDRVIQTDRASPLRWTAPEYSRFNPAASETIDGVPA